MGTVLTPNHGHAAMMGVFGMLGARLCLLQTVLHADLARQAEVGRAIAGMPMTRIVVAHRPQTLALVDRIVELSSGRVISDEANEPTAMGDLRW